MRELGEKGLFVEEDPEDLVQDAYLKALEGRLNGVAPKQAATRRRWAKLRARRWHVPVADLDEDTRQAIRTLGTTIAHECRNRARKLKRRAERAVKIPLPQSVDVADEVAVAVDHERRVRELPRSGGGRILRSA